MASMIGPFLLGYLFMPFLVIYFMYSYICLIMDAKFWHSDIHIDLNKIQSSFISNMSNGF
jgi:hypothetical protein